MKFRQHQNKEVIKITININPNLIDEFRDKVNESPIFYALYRNDDGKNKWNIICSTMDWLTVVSKGIPQIKIKSDSGFGTNHLLSLNYMQYIVAIDILLESIKQLYRVLNGENNYPLKNDKSIFNQKELSDDNYFKHIRAVFGTHPVNLNSIDGNRKNNNERFYASWSTASSLDHDFDFSVYLYSNKPGKDNVKFGFEIDKINKYAEKRYRLLKDLIKKVDIIIQNHISKKKEKDIINNKDPIKQIEILIKENEERISPQYGYAYQLNYLYRLLKVDIKDNKYKTIIENYRNYLIDQISNIKYYLQKMDFKFKLEKNTIYGYELEKIYNYLYDEKHQVGEMFFNTLIDENFLPSYLKSCDNFNEKELILDSILYKESKLNDFKSIDINDLI